ncbi:Aste57867_10226 [Aphanomyces stellatus]|uniref:Aste57867_10226 protein n=1 Tax=Aphanomyces stellatus TaxID=120398 RepID=A0A485KQK9_9STRA|nr:hypothetical protein As57867_010187 [Aphanomyces stellatus]VFT87101.1 Aste57867_10226 [Aphanomyces stellatus]
MSRRYREVDWLLGCDTVRTNSNVKSISMSKSTGALVARGGTGGLARLTASLSLTAMPDAFVWSLDRVDATGGENLRMAKWVLVGDWPMIEHHFALMSIGLYVLVGQFEGGRWLEVYPILGSIQRRRAFDLRGWADGGHVYRGLVLLAFGGPISHHAARTLCLHRAREFHVVG